MKELKDNDLREFCDWYRQRFKRCCTTASVFVTCMCGHFSSYEKAMRDALKRMQSLGLIIRHKNGMISITN